MEKIQGDWVETVYDDIENLSKNTHKRCRRDNIRFRDFVVGLGYDFHETCKSADIPG